MSRHASTSCPMCEQVHCICNEDRWSQEAPHPAEYVPGMAPRTDAADQGTANLNPRHAYIIMRAHARAMEVELIEMEQRENKRG